MAKDDIDLEGFDLDDFDFDVPDFEADADKSDSRTPVNRAVTGAIKGVKDEFASKDGIRKAMQLALPEGYGIAGDVIDSAASNTRALYDRITGESPELVSGSKKFGRKAMGLVGNKILPKKLSKRINDSLEDIANGPTQSDSDYRQEQENSDLAAIAEIFKAQNEAGAEKDRQEAVEKFESKALEQARFKTNMQALVAINRSMSRLVGYQDKVTAKYQQKMLELNYRQAATSKQLLDAFTISSQKQEAILENIRKNTALPEAVKIRGSEMFGQLAKQRLLGSGLNTISNWAQNYTQQVMTNANGLVQGIISPLTQAQQMGEGIDKAQMGGHVVGSMIGGQLRDRAASALAPLLARNKTIARGNEYLRGIFSGLPQKVNEWAQSSTEGTGMKSVGIQMLKDFLPKFMLDSRAGGDSLDTMDEMATFDKISRRTLIEVIPGYLSEIAHWSRVAVTGEKDSERKVFNLVRGGFTSEKEQLKDVGRQILPRQERESLRLAAEEFVKEIGGDTLSPKAQRVLKHKILDELANGRGLKPERLVQRDQYPGSDPDAVDEVVSLIADTFNVDPETGKPLDNSTEQKRRTNNLSDQFLRMSSMIPAVGDRVRIFSDMLGKDSMRKLGFIERDKDGREDRVNFNRLWETIFDNEDEGSGQTRSSKGSPADPNRDDSTVNRLIGNNKVASIIAGSADGADGRSSLGKSNAPSAKGLERYLGDKSTLITILTASREFHSRTVELLQELTNCGCNGASGGGNNNVANNVSSYFARMKSGISNQYGRASSYTRNTIVPKFNAAKVLGRDIWIQGEDHPVLQEAKLKAGHYRDTTTGKVLEKWEDIRGDVEVIGTDIKVRYDDLMSSAVMTDARGRVVTTLAKYHNRFKDSKAGAKVSEAVAAASVKVAELRGDGKMSTLVDNVGEEVLKAGSAVQDKAKSAKTKLKPRLRRMMKFFTGKAGEDITSELTGDHQEDMLTLSVRNAQLQYKVYRELAGEKVRKGSMQDIWSRRKELKDKAKEAIAGKYADAKGLLGMGGAAGAGAGVVDKLSDMFGGDGGTDIDIYTGGDGDKKTKKGKKSAKPRGRLGRAWDWTKGKMGRGLDKLGTFGKAVKLGGKAVGAATSGAWWLTKNAAKAGWWATKGVGRLLGSQGLRTAAGIGLRAVGGAALGALGLVSAPVLAGVGIVAGAASIGMYIHGALKDRLPNLAKLRFVQYGLEPIADSEFVAGVAKFESHAARYVTVTDDKASVNLDSIDFKQLEDAFGLAIDEDGAPRDHKHFERVHTFVKGRWKEVFLAHVSALYKLTKSTEIGKIDTLVTGQARVSLVNSLQMADKKDLFDVMVAPFAKKDELDYDADDVEDEYDDIKTDVIREAAIDISKENARPKSGAAATGASLAAIHAESTRKAAEHLAKREASTGKAPGEVIKSASQASSIKGMGPEAKAVFGTVGVAAVTAVASAGSDHVPDELDFGRAVRYRTYGLTEMLESKVTHLARLESELFARVSYDKDKNASVGSAEDAHKVAESIFNPTTDDEREDTYVWFYRRFLPTFLEFCGNVRRHANIDAREAGTKLKPAQLYDVLKAVAATRDNSGISVWEIPNSPWKGYVLADDPSITADPLKQLQGRIKDKLLDEEKTPGVVRRVGANGKLEDLDPTQVNRPSSTNTGGGFFSSIADGAKSAFNGIKSFFGYGSDNKVPQTGGIAPNGQMGGYNGPPVGDSAFPDGIPISHPGGGTGGNINDIPAPMGDGWENSKLTLMAAANMVGVDPSLASAVAGVESAHKPHARPWSKKENRYLSSAASYYQVIDGTWDYLMGKYASKYGIAPGTRQNDPRANALLGLEYIRENIDQVKGVVGNRGVRDTDVYLAHFLGPGGARRFLRANPGDPALNHVESGQANSNPAIFWDANGRPRTVAAVYGDFDNKLKKWRMPDAQEVAAMLKGTPLGEQVAEQQQQEGGDTTQPLTGEIVGPMPEQVAGLPSMAKPSESTPTNTVAESSSATTPVETAEQQADVRQVRNTIAPMAVSASIADSQSSVQTAQQTSVNADAGSMGKLISVNEQQLSQLIAMVELLKMGGATAVQGGVLQASAEPVKQGNVNQRLKVPTALPKGTVSTARV